MKNHKNINSYTRFLRIGIGMITRTRTRILSLFISAVLAFLVALLVVRNLSDISAGALSAILGVIVGGVIAASTQIWNSGKERHTQLRLAAVDRRLEAHQEAFALWRKLVSNVHDEEKGNDVVMECQNWWDKNCLYLTSQAREAFRWAYMCAHNHNSFKQDRSNPELIKSNWEDIMRAGSVIVEGSSLPSIGDTEAEYIGADGKIKKA